MALNRRNGQRFEANIWPGFVDAMTALLLVLVFVLSIFMIVQFMLRETISVQDDELNNLSSEVLALVDALGFERNRAEELTDQAQSLNAQLDNQAQQAAQQAALIALLQQQTADQAGRIGSFEEQVASLISRQGNLQNQLVTLGDQRDALQGTVEDLSDQNRQAVEQVNSLTARLSDLETGLIREISEKEAAQLALAQARTEIDVSEEEARLAAAQREALELLITNLRNDAVAQDLILNETNEALNAKNEALFEASETLSKTDAARLVQAAAAEALRERLKDSNAELTAMSLTLEEKRREAEETLTLLAAAKASEGTLNDRLIKALAATRLARATAATDEANLQDQLSEEQLARMRAEDKITLLLGQLQEAQGKDVTIVNLRQKLDAALLEQRNSENELVQARSEADAAALDLLEELQATQLDAAQSERSLRQELAAALAAENAARDREEGVLGADEQKQALLSAAQTELANERELSSKNARQIEALNQQIAQLRSELGGLQNLLDASNARDKDANIEIQSLGSQLNRALAQVASEQKLVATEQKRVAEEQARLADEQRKRAELEEAERIRLEAEAKELKNYRSEFFGQLRDLLGDQEGIRIEGDRFVFSSEVLFRPGQANLSAAGRDEISKVAAILSQVSDDIPDTLDWIIRVDGHTDNEPLSGFGEFSDNWELSQARALSVVRFMSRSLGIPPERLAANGFGEYQPIAAGDTLEARAQNRRIELKLTEK